MTVPAATPDVLRVSGPAHLLEILPYLVGFRPEASLVAIGLIGERQRVGLTVRLDLAALGTATGPDAGGLAYLAETLDKVGQHADGLVVVVVPGCADSPATPGADAAPGDDEAADGAQDEDPGVAQLPYRWLAEAAAEWLADRGLALWDALCVSTSWDRWWSYRCGSSACCPPEGRPLDPAGEVAAEAVLRGLPALDSRGGLVAELRPEPGAVAAVAAALNVALAPGGRRRPVRDAAAPSVPRRRRSSTWRRQQLAFLDTLVAAGQQADEPLEPRDAARALVALHDLHVRDACIHLALRHDRSRRGAVSASERLWRGLVRAAPAGWAAPAATLLALATYARGDGARANVAVDRALADDPDYPMADLVQQMLVTLLPPERFVDRLAELSREVWERLAADQPSGALPAADRRQERSTG